MSQHPLSPISIRSLQPPPPPPCAPPVPLGTYFVFSIQLHCVAVQGGAVRQSKVPETTDTVVSIWRYAIALCLVLDND